MPQAEMDTSPSLSKCVQEPRHNRSSPDVGTCKRRRGQYFIASDFENTDQCSDLIVYLKSRPFSSLSYEEKWATKERRPKPHLNIVQTDKHVT